MAEYRESHGADNASPQGEGGRDRGGYRRGGRPYLARRRVCHFCIQKGAVIDYKQAQALEQYLTDRGKIRARRKTGTCARHQRRLAIAVKRARHLAMLPYTVTNLHPTGY